MKQLFGIIFITLLVANCKRNPCHDTNCRNGGICYDGRCECPYLFKGTFCEKQWREEFYGIYNATDNCSLSSAVTYSVTISDNSSGIDHVNILNLLGYNQTTCGIVDDNFSSIVNIPSQILHGDTLIEGSVNFSSSNEGSLNLTVSYTDGTFSLCFLDIYR